MNQEATPPKAFINYCYERSFSYPKDKLDSLWQRLQLRETFTRGQIFPYRVEFAAPSQKGEFSSGELNIHHGPFLSVHGAIDEITPKYRGLNYFYGSYVISFRLVRPTQLEFIREENVLTVKLTAFVRPWFKPFWHLINTLLWKSFSLTFR